MKSSIREHTPVYYKFFAWLNIGVQAFSPGRSIYPIFSRASSDVRFLLNSTQSRLLTRIYTLGHGETVSSVAASFNMATDAWAALTSFAPFDDLQPGDELDVPIS